MWRGLLPALLCLPLLASLTTKAAAQTPVGERLLPPARVTAIEGSGAFSITLTGKPDQDNRQIYLDSASGSGTCMNGDPYQANTGTGHAITVSTANTSRTFGGFVACDDSADEADSTPHILTWRERNTHPTFRSTAGHCSSGVACFTTLTIRDNDPTIVSLARVGSGAVTEGGTIEFTVTLGRALVASEIIDVPLSIGGTNVTTGDWSLGRKSGAGLNTGVTLSGTNTATPTVRFSGVGAQTATLELTPTADSTTEGAETFTIALGPNGGGANGFDRTTLGTNVGGGADPHGTPSMNRFTVTVNDLTATPTVTITEGNAVTEGTGAAFMVSRSGATTAALTVLLAVSENTAGGRDFVASGDEGNKQVVIPSGSTAQTYTVPTSGDSEDEPNGAVTVALRDSTGYTRGSPNSATVTVNDNDATTVTVVAIRATTTESPANIATEAGRFRIVLNRGLRAGEVLAIPLQVTGGTLGTHVRLQKVNDVTGVGYDAATGTVTFTGSAGGSNANQHFWVIAEDDNDSDNESIGIGVPASSETGTPRMTATGLGGGATGSGTVTITVTDDDPVQNTAPTVANAIPDRTATVGTAFSYQFPANTFTDADSDPLTYTAAQSGGSTLPTWLTFTANTRTFAGTPALADVGTVTVRVTASDGNGGSVSDDFTLTVGTSPPSNTAPTVANAIPDRTARVGTAFNYQVPANTFIDADSDSLTYTAAQSDGAALPTWLSFAANTRTFSGTPSAGDVGTVTVRVTASDGHGGSVSDDFTLRVRTPPTPNTAPTVAHDIPDRTATAGTAFRYQVPADRFEDADRDSLTYTAVQRDGAALPTWLTFDAGTRTFAGTPAAGDAGTVTVRVTADDGHGGRVSADFVLTVRGPTPTPVVRFATDAATAAEHAGTQQVTVTLSPPPATPLTLTYTVGGTATAGAGNDYTLPFPGSLVVAAKQATVTIPVALLADPVAEAPETVILTLTAAPGYRVGRPHRHTLTITDHEPGAALTAPTSHWLARFGRTVTGQAVTGITARLAAPRTPGLTGTVAGLALDRLGAGPALAPARPGPLTDAPLASRRPAGGRRLAFRDLLAGSAFTLTSAPAATGGSYALWGQGGWTRFAGQAGPWHVEGETQGGTLGVDWAQGAWVLGVAVSHTQGEGTSASPTQHRDLKSRLTLVTPYASVAVTEQVTLWSTVGYGRGTTTLTRPTAPAGKTDTALLLAAGGLRGHLLEPPPTGGLAVAVRSDARFLRTTAEAGRVPGLAALEADVVLLRLGLEGTWHRPVADGGAVVPRLELGLRQDAGDAETGWGVDVRGGVRWAAPAWGLTLDVAGQTLLAHSDRHFETWGGTATVQWTPAPGAATGPTLTLRQTAGASPAPGAGPVWTDNPVALLPAPGPAAVGLTAEGGWGFALGEGAWVGTPTLAYGWAPASRELSLGWRLASRPPRALGLALTVTHRAAVRTPAVQGVRLSLTRNW